MQMQQNDVTWVLVSDAARARVFETALESGHQERRFKLVQQFEHPQSRAHNRDLASDRPGRNLQSGTAGAGHSTMEPPTTPKQVEHEVFARELAQEMDKALKQNAFSHLILTANPEFLGLLRNNLTPQVKKHVTASVDKDYTSLDARDLQWRLSGMLPE